MWEWLANLKGGAPTVVGTLTGSAIGFVTLVLGALLNFHLNRQRDAEIRAEEARSVAAALYSEIRLLRRELAAVGRRVARTALSDRTDQKFDAHFVDQNTLPDAILYKALASKLGLLSGELVIRISEFYSNYETTRLWIPRLVRDPDRGYIYSSLYVLNPLCAAIKNISSTLRSIELYLGLPPDNEILESWRRRGFDGVGKRNVWTQLSLDCGDKIGLHPD